MKTPKSTPGVGELDLIVGVHAPGEMRKNTSCVLFCVLFCVVVCWSNPEP